jgi:vitamin B12 transporter
MPSTRVLLLSATLAAALATIPLTAGAQDATMLPTVVVTATRIPTLIESIPAGVSVITRATIEARGYSTLADALASVPGMHIAPSGGPGGVASVFVRGTNSGHVLVLRDGIPVNDPSDPGGQFNFGVDTLDDVQRIEVVRGPMAGIYGSGAIGGVINLITRHGANGPEGKPRVTGELGFGLPRAVRGAIGLSGSIGGFDYNLNVAHRDDAGFDTTPQRESVHTGARNPYRATTASVDFGYTPAPGTRISLYLRGRSARFKLDDVGYPAFDSTNYVGTDDNVFGRLAVNSLLFDGRLEAKLSLSHLWSDRQYLQALEAADPSQASGDTKYRGRRTTLQWDNTLHLPEYGFATGNALLFGYSHTEDASHSRLNTISGGFPYISSVNAASHSDAGHVGLQTTLAKRLTLTADLRGEAGTYGGNALTWRTGAVLAVPEVWSHFKLAYGTGFRAPSLFDLFGVDSTGYIGNPKLKPERSTGWEAGLVVDIPAFGRADFASIGVTYFDNRVRDLITTVFNSTYTAATSANVSHARSTGVETSVTLRPASWIEMVMSYTYTDAHDLSTGARLLRRPQNAASLNARITPLPGLSIAPELIFSGPFTDYLVDSAGFPAGIGRAKSGLIANLTVTQQLNKSLTLFVDARNLGGSRFEPASGYQMPGPSVLAGVRARF